MSGLVHRASWGDAWSPSLGLQPRGLSRSADLAEDVRHDEALGLLVVPDRLKQALLRDVDANSCPERPEGYGLEVDLARLADVKCAD